MTVDRALDGVKVLIGIGALVSLPATGLTLGTTKQLLEMWKSGGTLIKAVGKTRASAIEAELITCLNFHFEPYQGEKDMGDTAIVVLQMIKKAEARPADIAQCKLDAARLTETLLKGFDGDADYSGPAVQSLFRATVTDAYTRLFGNKDFVDSLTPALWAGAYKMLEGIASEQIVTNVELSNVAHKTDAILQMLSPLSDSQEMEIKKRERLAIAKLLTEIDDGDFICDDISALLRYVSAVEISILDLLKWHKTNGGSR